MKRGCMRPFLAATVILLVFMAALIAWHWPTFSLMLDNMRAMGEEAETAREMRTPDDLLAYIASHPEDVSLVAYDVGRDDEGIFYGADRRRPVAGVTSLLVLAEYARQVEEGRINPDEPIAREAVTHYHLPGTGRTAVQETGENMEEREARSLQQLVQQMMHEDDNAAEDWLIDRLGRRHVAAAPSRLDMPATDAPLPSSGLFLTWSNSALTSTPAERLQAFRAMDQPAYAATVYDMAQRLQNDEAFRRRESERLAGQGSGLSLRWQRNLAHSTFPRGTAADYASLLARAATDSLLSRGVSRQIRGIIEVAADTTLPALEAVGSESGSFPGIVSFVGYAEQKGGQQKRVLALFMENMPMALFYHLMRTGLDTGLQLRLLVDDKYFEHARQLLLKRHP